MSDETEPRVFDSITAAVENSLPPVPPPYAVLTASEDEPVPEDQGGPETPGDGQQGAAPEGIQETPPPETTVQPDTKRAPAKKTAAKSATARAGNARVGTKAKGAE